jgi:hypothetical protein
MHQSITKYKIKEPRAPENITDKNHFKQNKFIHLRNIVYQHTCNITSPTS